MITLIIATFIWFACGVLAYGITIAHFSGAYTFTEPKDHIGIALVSFLYGPVGLLMSFILSDFAKYGIRFR